MKLVSLFQPVGRTGGSLWSWSVCFSQTVEMEVYREAGLSVSDAFPFTHYNQKISHCNKNISRYNGKPPLVTGLISCSQCAVPTGTMGTGIIVLTCWECLYVCICVCMCVFMNVCLYVCVFVCLYVCLPFHQTLLILCASTQHTHNAHNCGWYEDRTDASSALC